MNFLIQILACFLIAGSSMILPRASSWLRTISIRLIASTVRFSRFVSSRSSAVCSSMSASVPPNWDPCAPQAAVSTPAHRSKASPYRCPEARSMLIEEAPSAAACHRTDTDMRAHTRAGAKDGHFRWTS